MTVYSTVNNDYAATALAAKVTPVKTIKGHCTIYTCYIRYSCKLGSNNLNYKLNS